MSGLTVLVSDDRHRVAVVGEVDIATSAELDAALTRLSGDIDVDCTAVEFIGATGFNSFDRIHRAALARGTAFTVSGMNGFQRQLAARLAVPYVLTSRSSASSASDRG